MFIQNANVAEPTHGINPCEIHLHYQVEIEYNYPLRLVLQAKLNTRMGLMCFREALDGGGEGLPKKRKARMSLGKEHDKNIKQEEYVQ